MAEKHTPGQHLLAINAAYFNGGGWVDPLEWSDFDAEGHAKWEEMAKAIALNLRAASHATDLLEALKGLLAVAEMTTFSDEYPAECEAARSAISRATGEGE